MLLVMICLFQTVILHSYVRKIEGALVLHRCLGSLRGTVAKYIPSGNSTYRATMWGPIQTPKLVYNSNILVYGPYYYSYWGL